MTWTKNEIFMKKNEVLHSMVTRKHTVGSTSITFLTVNCFTHQREVNNNLGTACTIMYLILAG
uniref:Uncharacterized protein n=1 Tax=Rhizophora mucronata TaxID=61149 RepID=A0A2P2NB48_RHIMU